MQTIIVGRDYAAQDTLANLIREEMKRGQSGVVITTGDRLIESAVHSWKETQHAQRWEKFHWIELEYGAPFSFPVNLLQTPKALMEVWRSLGLPGYLELQEAVSWYTHREETATIFKLNDYFLLQRVKENRRASLPEWVIGEAISFLAPLKAQVGQTENRITMKRWLEEGHWVFFDVKQLEPKLQAFFAEYVAVLYENERDGQSAFVVNGIPPSVRIQQFENLFGAFPDVDELENWIRDNRERRFTIFSTTAEEAKRLNDLNMVSMHTDTASLKPRECIQTGRTGVRRTFVSPRVNPSVSASLKHQIQEKDGPPRERILSLLHEQQDAGW